VVCARTPDLFGAVGWWYERFEPTSDGEVRQLLHWGRPAPPSQELFP
jgi:predicted phosphoribosyltransferase